MKKSKSRKAWKADKSLAAKIARDPVMQELAENEATYRKFAPKNKKETKELLLCKLIQAMEQRLRRTMAEADELKRKTNEYDLEQEVFDKVLATHPDKQEKWKYNWAGWFNSGEEEQLQSAEDDIAYTVAWLKVARSMITTKRYETIPKDLFEHLQFTGDGGVFWTDEIRMPPPTLFEDDEEIKPEDIPF